MANIEESSYLDHEVEVAKHAIARLKSQVIHDLALAAQPLPWAERYPLPALGVCAAGGLAAAAVIKPMIMGEKDRGEPVAGRMHYRDYYDDEPAPRRRRGIVAAALVAPLLNLLKSTVKSALVAAVSAKAAQASAESEMTSPQPSKTKASTVTAATAGATQ